MNLIVKVQLLFSNCIFLAITILPWPVRRMLMNSLFGYKIDNTARIGFSWIRPRKLIMGPGSKIEHFTICKGLDLIELAESATIGRLNWITGFPSSDSRHFQSDINRCPCLKLEKHAAITNRHILDCTNSISIGAFTTIAGFRSQFLTHSIDLSISEQRSHPISIGEYCFIGTGVIVLGGSSLPSHSILAAGSLLSKSYDEKATLYGGMPARPIKIIDVTGGYFVRDEGFVN